MNLHDVDTPALVLDRARTRRNIDRMRAHAASRGVRLRPHLKTCKSIDVARMMQPLQGATVSTLREAGYFLDGGITDVLYAVGVTPDKLGRIDDLQSRGARITVVVDAVQQARALVARADALRSPLSVLIEIDCDGHRAGVPPEDGARLTAIAEVLRDSRRLALRGVMTHAGGAYESASPERLEAYARRERDAVLIAAKVLRAAGVGVSIVSVGSTPTANTAIDLAGVTEMRPGVFVFNDLVMAGLGVCAIDDIALSVMASVIGHREDRGWILIDAGWTALSADRGTARLTVDQGFGMVCDIHARPVADLLVIETNQEHGIIASRSGTHPDARDFPIGTRLRILPNHACATATMHTSYCVIAGDPGDAADAADAASSAPAADVIAVWPRCTGW